jgi:YHS domain-containing protein
MLVAMIVAALVVDAAFSALGLIPTGPRPTRADVFGSVQLDYKLALNVLGLGIFAALLALTVRRGATDPVCGMTVDRAKALTAQADGRTVYFCSPGCRDAFTSDA